MFSLQPHRKPQRGGENLCFSEDAPQRQMLICINASGLVAWVGEQFVSSQGSNPRHCQFLSENLLELKI